MSCTVVRDFQKKKVAEYLKPGGRYLIRFQHGLGDAIMFMPLVAQLRNTHADCVIDVALHRGQDQIFKTVVDDPEKYDFLFWLGFTPVESGYWHNGDTRTKSEVCCQYEMGIPPIYEHAKIPTCPSPLVGLGFTSSACGWGTAPDEVPPKVRAEVAAAGFIPFDAAAPDLRKLAGLIQRCFAYIGIISGPLNMAISIMPERTLCLETPMLLRQLTRKPIAKLDAMHYTDGSVKAWLEKLK